MMASQWVDLVGEALGDDYRWRSCVDDHLWFHRRFTYVVKRAETRIIGHRKFASWDTLVNLLVVALHGLVALQGAVPAHTGGLR